MTAQDACKGLELLAAVFRVVALDQPLPDFLAGIMTPKKVLLVLGRPVKEANARFFQDLKGGWWVLAGHMPKTLLRDR